MKVQRGSTTGSEESARTSSPALVLEVAPNYRLGGWGVCAQGSSDPLFVEERLCDASDKAVNHLSAHDGGKVMELSRDGYVVGGAVVPKSLSRAEILQAGRAISEAESGPLIGPDTAVEFDVADADLEFAVALWHVCSESRGIPWKETDLGFAFQHGPHLLLNRHSGRFELEVCETTAAAMRRFRGIVRDDLAQTQTGLLVLEELEVKGRRKRKLSLQPGDFIRRGVGRTFAKLGSGWVEAIALSDEQLATMRPVCVVRRDLDYFFVSPPDAVVFEELTGAKFVKH